MLEVEDVAKLLLGVDPDLALEAYQRIYPESKVRKFDGIIVFEIKKV